MNIWQNLNKDENGFLHIELLILMAILSSVAMIYICMGILRNQQLNNGYRMTAIYLAQGYLNLMEEQKANMIPNQIECNGMKYMIKQNEFFQDDIDDIEQLKQQEALIKDKQKLVQNLEEKSVNIYAILINLGANTVDDVALTDLKIKDGEIFLKGRARNYQNIAVYKEILSEIRFFQTSEIGEIKINTEDNLLDFTMKIVMR